MFLLNAFSFLLGIIVLTEISGDVADDFRQLAAQLPGLSDKEAQYLNDIAQDLSLKQGHQWLITSLSEEQVNLFRNRKNFYIEQHVNGSESDVIHQRLYSVGLDSSGGEPVITMKIYAFADPTKVLHAKANASVFSTLTTNDLVYEKNCDVFWARDKLQLLQFRSWTEKDCFITVGREAVYILVSNNLTYSYLTPFVKWILASRTDILGEPSPYKMTRSSPDNPPLLASFRDVLAALTKGMKIRYTAFLDSCTTATKSGTSDLPHELGGSVGSFEYFNESRFGPEEFFGFTSSGIKVNETGLVRELTEVLVFGSGTVSINITVLSPDFSREIRKITFACHLGANARQSQSFFFYTDGVTPTPLLTFQDLQKSLESGHEVRSVSKYYNCQGIQANAIGGGPIEDFHIHDDKILNSQSTLITNYQGAGYVYDVVSATYWSNGSVIFTASDVDVVTYKPYYSEQIICHFGGDSMYFYRF